MSESAGSCAIVSQRKPMDDFKNCWQQRRIAKQEIRKNELSQKGENGNLTTAEAMELAGYKIEEGLEKIAKMNADSVCYLA